MQSYSKWLASKKPRPEFKDGKADEALAKLQQKMLRSQQGLWRQKQRAIILFEGVDAAGKGGCIRRLTEPLDPRGIHVWPIGAPSAQEQGKHWLYRFWTRLPAPGDIALFDRSWYGRVLVERVEKLIDKKTYKRAYDEINEFEAMLSNDGIEVIKIFLGISKKEQLRRFEERLNNPYKQWKINADDVKARAKWDEYVEAIDKMLETTSTKAVPWHFISSEDKDYARVEVLKVVTDRLKSQRRWLEKHSQAAELNSVKKALAALS